MAKNKVVEPGKKRTVQFNGKTYHQFNSDWMEAETYLAPPTRIAAQLDALVAREAADES